MSELRNLLPTGNAVKWLLASEEINEELYGLNVRLFLILIQL